MEPLTIFCSIACLFIVLNWHRFQLGTLTFNESVDVALDSILTQQLLFGISKVTLHYGGYEMTVEFKNGVKMTAWNSNKYYAWLIHGSIGDYKWKDGRPKAGTMVKLKRAIVKYHIEKAKVFNQQHS